MILRETREWRRPRHEIERSADLTDEEQANVKRALRTLRARAGSWGILAASLKVTRQALERAGRPKGIPTAGLAVRAARFVGVPVDDLLSGKFAPAGACPMCGRVG